MAKNRSGVTLALCTLLHATTHALGSMLVPLYLIMRDDLRRGGVKEIALIVTVYGLVYCLLSYPAGILADRWNRMVVLGVGMIGNACAVALMGLTHRYELLLALGVMGGMFGAVFHP
ncbi:MAG TPA: MFS transporter, partial [Tepidisphaeraceae bacterium]|nr:MFS transporter [Tepidisphaeraceae bacterium]